MWEWPLLDEILIMVFRGETLFRFMSIVFVESTEIFILLLGEIVPYGSWFIEHVGMLEFLYNIVCRKAMGDKNLGSHFSLGTCLYCSSRLTSMEGFPLISFVLLGLGISALTFGIAYFGFLGSNFSKGILSIFVVYIPTLCSLILSSSCWFLNFS